MSTRIILRAALHIGIAFAAIFFAHSAYGQVPPPIVITEIRPLEFGGCDIVGGATYTVDAANTPGAGACTGANSARFDITGDPNARVTISLPNKVDITNGTDTLTVNISKSPTGGNIRFDAAGNLTIFVGGNFRIPPAGLGTSGLFLVTAILDVIYK